MIKRIPFLALALAFATGLGSNLFGNAPTQGSIAPLSASSKLRLARSSLAKRGLPVNFTRLGGPWVWTARVGKNSKGHIKLGPGVDLIDYSKEGILLPTSASGAQQDLVMELNLSLPSNGSYVVDVFVEPGPGTGSPVFYGYSRHTGTGANLDTNYQSTFTGLEKHFIFVLQGFASSFRIKVGANRPWTFHRVEVSKLG